jgi:hypothetical protein
VFASGCATASDLYASCVKPEIASALPDVAGEVLSRIEKAPGELTAWEGLAISLGGKYGWELLACAVEHLIRDAADTQTSAAFKAMGMFENERSFFLAAAESTAPDHTVSKHGKVCLEWLRERVKKELRRGKK